jgi:hypothetical protein
LRSPVQPLPVEFLDADAVRRLPVALYAPMHALPNVLPFHNNMTYSANDKPTPDIVSTLLRIGSSFIRYSIFLCVIFAYLLSYIVFSGFANDAPLIVNAYLISSLKLYYFTLPYHKAASSGG